MKAFLLFATLWGTVLAWAPALYAAEAERGDEKEAPDRRPERTDRVRADLGHGGQFSLRAGLAAGYRVMFRYDESPLCRPPQDDEGDPQRLCGFAAPLGLDLALGFAPLGFVEPYLWARLGLAAEDQTDTEALKVLGVGVRLYSRSEEPLKIFVEPALGLELEGGQGSAAYQVNRPSYDTDLVFHIAAGPQYDITENVGLFLGAGLTAGVLRAIHTNMEVQFGAQGRY